MKVYFEELREYGPAIERGFKFLGQDSKLNSSTRVSIKPNLTFPEFRKGVMTNPEAIEALIIYLKNFTNHITICESDSGGYNRFSMTEVFSKTGIAEFSKRYGVQVVNMSESPARSREFKYSFRNFSVPIPTLLTDETDLFITMPVPKVHANTGVSLALKNQWGVIQIPAMRLKLHPFFQEVIYQVNKSLPQHVVVLDGRFGLTRNGPMRGDVVELGWFLMCDNMYANDMLVAKMMGFDPFRISYLRHILKKEGLSWSSDITYNRELPTDNRFYLNREWTDYPGLFTFKSRLLAYVGYESALAKPLHWLLYKFREPFY